MKIAIVYGSCAPIPPVRGIAPGIVIYYTVEHLQLSNSDELAVFSHWEAALDGLDYDRQKYHSVRDYPIVRIAIRLFKKLPYRFYHPLLSAWFGQTDDDWLKYAVSLLFQVHAYRPDVIVCHVNYKLPLLLRYFCPQAKILYYHHGSNMHLRLSADEWRTFQKNLDGLVSVSQAALDGVTNTFGSIQVPHWVIHNGVNDNLFRPTLKDTVREQVRAHYQIASDDFVFLYAGRIYPTKGIQNLISVFLKLENQYPKAKLLIAGSADKENRPDFDFERKIQEMASALPERIIFTGWFPNEKMPELMAIADVLVLVAVTEEGIPLSLLESMACATPVIATSIGGIPEIVQHGETGLLISIENLETDLSTAMQTYLTDHTLWQRCSIQAAEVVQSKYTYRQVTSKFLEILEEYRKPK